MAVPSLTILKMVLIEPCMANERGRPSGGRKTGHFVARRRSLAKQSSISYDIPIASSARTPPLAVSLAQYHGRQVAVDLIQRSKDGEETSVEWRAIVLADQNASKVPQATKKLPKP